MACTAVRPPIRQSSFLSILTDCASRRWPLLSVLAGGHGLLCRQHLSRRRLGQEEVLARARRLLRVPAPQEGGWLTGAEQPFWEKETRLTRHSTRERWHCKPHTPELSQQPLETMRRAQARYGIWGF